MHSCLELPESGTAGRSTCCRIFRESEGARGVALAWFASVLQLSPHAERSHTVDSRTLGAINRRMHRRVVRRWAMSAYGALILPGTVLAQRDRLDGPIKLSAGENLTADSSRQKTLSVTTERIYGCGNYVIDAVLERRSDTIAVDVRGLTYPPNCTAEFAPATRGFTLAVPDGTYWVAVTRGHDVDRVRLTITADRMRIDASDGLRFIRPDTSTFWRVPLMSFMLYCGTPNEPELCADIAWWLERQAGIHELPIPSTGRMMFPLAMSTWRSEFHLYAYDADTALAPVRRCMHVVADAVAPAVGVSILIVTASGERMPATSQRANHEPHVPVTTRVTGSCR